jgi:hypothetical protein
VELGAHFLILHYPAANDARGLTHPSSGSACATYCPHAATTSAALPATVAWPRTRHDKEHEWSRGERHQPELRLCTLLGHDKEHEWSRGERHQPELRPCTLLGHDKEHEWSRGERHQPELRLCTPARPRPDGSLVGSSTEYVGAAITAV